MFARTKRVTTAWSLDYSQESFCEDLYYIVLYFINIMLYCIVLYYIILYYIISYYKIELHSVLLKLYIARKLPKKSLLDKSCKPDFYSITFESYMNEKRSHDTGQNVNKILCEFTQYVSCQR